MPVSQLAHLSRHLPRLILAWCLLFCLFRGLVNTWLNLSPEGDEGSFVDLALNVAEGRGFVQSGLNPMRLQDGFFPPECGRQPLWPLLLSVFADRTPIFFTEGKLLMLVISLVAVAATYLLVGKTYGRLAAMLATLVLSVNVVFQFYFVQVVCEVPLGVLFFAAFMAMVWGFRDERWWPVAGALAGLAWLTKATVSILLITFLLTALIRDRRAALRKKFLWLLLAAFLVITSPWTIRNWRLFGNPFYDYNSANVFWLDSWHQFWQPYEPDGLPTLRTYVQTHTLGHAAARLFGGAKVMASQFPVSLTPMPTTLLPLDAQHTDLLGYTLLAVFGFGVLRVGLRRDATEPERKEMLFVLLLMAAFFVAFSWYSVAGFSVRFLIPLVFIMCAYIGRTLAGGLTWLAAALRPRIRGLAATSDEACATALGFGLAILLLGSTTYDTLRESRRLAWTEPLKAFHCEPG
ncbi:MAG: glycosyltransferase family 39 protein, partial [Planctomycetes bacterium]|nr:glycosyltransferase family 39 protein [Planctomycetota bacterium]